MAKVHPKRAPARRRLRKAEPRSTGLAPQDCRLEVSAGELAELGARVAKEGGTVVGAYRDPLGGHALLLGILPVDRIEPTPFQRDLSQAHHRRLADVIHKTSCFR